MGSVVNCHVYSAHAPIVPEVPLLCGLPGPSWLTRGLGNCELPEASVHDMETFWLPGLGRTGCFMLRKARSRTLKEASKREMKVNIPYGVAWYDQHDSFIAANAS